MDGAFTCSDKLPGSITIPLSQSSGGRKGASPLQKYAEGLTGNPGTREAARGSAGGSHQKQHRLREPLMI